MLANISILIILTYCFDITFSVLNLSSQSTSASYEKLIQHQQYNQIQIQYRSNYLILPHSLIKLLQSMNFTRMQLKMGYLKPKNRKINKQIQNLVFKGISMSIQNRSEFTMSHFKNMAQIFSISRDTQFLIYFKQTSTLYASNPNDKFCSQHLYQIVNTFLPCKVNKGLGRLINLTTVFVNNQFFAVDFLITKTFVNQSDSLIFKIKFYLPKNGVQQIQSYLLREESQRSKCPYLDKLQFEKTMQKNQFQNEIKQKQRKQIMLNVMQSFTKSNWYSPNKQLFSKISIKKLYAQLQNNQYQLSSIIIRYLFPFGFQLETINSNIQIFELTSQNLDNTQQFTSKLVTVKYFVKNKQIFSNSQNIQILIKYRSHLKGFQNYQTISGGGQQFMNLPLIVGFIQQPQNASIQQPQNASIQLNASLIQQNGFFIQQNRSLMSQMNNFLQIQQKNNKQQMQFSIQELKQYNDSIQRNSSKKQKVKSQNHLKSYIKMNQISYILIESNKNNPDFSIPFHTITFTVAILGYLWISIWKIYFKQAQERLFKNKSKSNSPTNQNAKNYCQKQKQN